MMKTNSGRHLISESQNKINKNILENAAQRLFGDSLRRKVNMQEMKMVAARMEEMELRDKPSINR